MKSKKMYKSIVAIALVCVMLVMCMGAGYSGGKRGLTTIHNISLRGALNVNFMDYINPDKKDSLNEIENRGTHESAQEFQIELIPQSENFFNSYGQFIYDGEVVFFEANGMLNNFILDVNRKGYIGNLYGRILDLDIFISLSLHAIPSESKVFALITIGEATDTTGIETLAFGESFNEMNTLVELNVPQNNFSVTTFSAEEEKTARASADYNVSYRGIGVGQGYLLDENEYVDLIATTFYTTKKMNANSMYDAYVKVNSHNQNAAYYIRKQNNLIGTLTVWSIIGQCEIGSNESSLEVWELTPPDENWQVSFPIPYVSGGAFKSSPFSINIGFSTIETSTVSLFPDRDGVKRNNIAKWSHNYQKDMSWDSTLGPAETQIGYTGKCQVTPKYSHTSSIFAEMYGVGKVVYEYRSIYGAVQYQGTFAASSARAIGSVEVMPEV